jgi:hypothetical protein
LAVQCWAKTKTTTGATGAMNRDRIGLIEVIGTITITGGIGGTIGIANTIVEIVINSNRR